MTRSMHHHPHPPLSSRPTAEGWYEVQWRPGDDWQRVYLFEGGETWGFDQHDDPESVGLDVNPEETLWRHCWTDLCDT